MFKFICDIKRFIYSWLVVKVCNTKKIDKLKLGFYLKRVVSLQPLRDWRKFIERFWGCNKKDQKKFG